jgi:MFS family permease
VINKPKFYYGYVITAACTIIMIVGWGTFFSYSVFFNSFIKEFGWSRATISGAFSCAMLVTGIAGIFAGRISDRMGPKGISIISSIMLGVGLILMSFIHSVWQIYVIYGILMATSIGGLWSTLISTVARWFDTKRGVITGIATSGIGIGSIVFSPFIGQLIVTYEWRKTFVIIGIMALVFMVPSAFFLKRQPRQIVLSNGSQKTIVKDEAVKNVDLTYKQAITTKKFWLLAQIAFLFSYSQMSITVHIVPIAIGLNIPVVSSAVILGLIGAASVFGRLITGAVSDRIRPKLMLFIILFVVLVSVIWLAFAKNLWALYLFATVFGFAYGGSSILQPLVLVDFFGLSSLGSLMGIMGLCVGISGLIGPIVTGYIFDITNSYQSAFFMFIITAGIALVSCLWLSPLRKKT